MAGDEYVAAVAHGAHALPLLIPVADPPLAIDDIFAAVDALLFTGSASNVAPRHYGGAPPRDPDTLDETRDATTLALLRAARSIDMPILCICRGFQEMNVAFGGTLHQHLHEVEGFGNHRENEAVTLSDRYAPAHAVTLTSDGTLAKLVPQLQFQVNSLHGQGVDRVAPGLQVEAVADDGVIEALSVPGASFALGVQWHPEWHYADDPISKALFAAFGAAACRFAGARVPA